jgi:inosine/xanthosine triphosphate pyrophosphatase family protein
MQLSTIQKINPTIALSSPPLTDWTLREQSLLYLPALGNSPAGLELEQTSATLEILLEQASHLSGLGRQAALQCQLILLGPHGYTKIVSATCEGMLTRREKGSNPFGFNSIFMKYDYVKTLAELPLTTTCRISARAKAFEKLRPKLEALADSETLYKAAPCIST